MIVYDGPHKAGLGGTQTVHHFDNGWGASVIKTPHSYGGNDDLWELAVLKLDEDGWSINYDHPVAEDDVRGYLTSQQVAELLHQIEATK